MATHAHPNRLIAASSPYLLQHAHNPVDWHEWGEEALQRAKDEDKPILVSIGYSACHWCHVMERECFEDEAIAALMNEHFVCIKVDREERPDLDEIYMNAAQALTGSGGWPLNVFLTPDLKPFVAGTYFPPEDRWGRPGFPTVLQRVAEAYRDRREQVEEAAASVTAAIARPALAGAEANGVLSYGLIEQCVADLAASFDEQWGGFGPAPKFPNAAALDLLLRYHHRTGDVHALRMATITLDRMAQGGMYDQLGGGFHRYAVDERWLVPHFEKMLYDNALLAGAYLNAYLATGDGHYAWVVRETLDYLLRDMADPSGGFQAATDADSEGEEGRYFVWDLAETRNILGPAEGALFTGFYGVTEAGKLEGRSILHVQVPLAQFAMERGADPDELRERLDDARRKLLAERAKRVPPGKDDKVLADWNGLAITAFARGHQVLGEERYREAAERAARFVLAEMRRDGRLLHAHRQGRSYVGAYLDDYAFMLQGLIDLYESTLDVAWIGEARALADRMAADFGDEAEGGFFFTPANRADLIVRPRKLYDGATPAGNAVAAGALLKLGRLTGDAEYVCRAEATLTSMATHARRLPRAFPALLGAIDSFLGDATEVVVVGAHEEEATRRLVATVRHSYVPNRVVAAIDPAGANADDAQNTVPLTGGKAPVAGRPAAYVCRGSACLPPVTAADELADLLKGR